MNWVARSWRSGLLRILVAVAAGALVWAALWLAGTTWALSTFPETLHPERPVTSNTALVLYIAYSTVLSLLAGYVTAWIGAQAAHVAIWSLALLQLSLGIAAELSYWALMPTWYHLVFLALIVPATITGGIIRTHSLEHSGRSPE